MYRYRALVSAGIVPAQTAKAGNSSDSINSGDSRKTSNSENSETISDSGLSNAEIRSIVREYRDQVPNAVFLVDLMLRDDLEQLIDGRLSRRGVQAVLRAADTLRQVQHVLGHPLPEVVREAITALNLDIDMLLARHMRADYAEPRLTPPTWRSPSRRSTL